MRLGADGAVLVHECELLLPRRLCLRVDALLEAALRALAPVTGGLPPLAARFPRCTRRLLHPGEPAPPPIRIAVQCATVSAVDLRVALRPVGRLPWRLLVSKRLADFAVALPPFQLTRQGAPASAAALRRMLRWHYGRLLLGRLLGLVVRWWHLAVALALLTVALALVAGDPRALGSRFQQA
jgi:hypothetical protein